MPLAMAKKCERLGQKNTRRATSLSPSVWLTLLVMAIYFASAWLTISLFLYNLFSSLFLYNSLSSLSLSLSLFNSLFLLQLKNIFVMVTQHLYPYKPCFFSLLRLLSPLEQFASCSPSTHPLFSPYPLPFLSSFSSSLSFIFQLWKVASRKSFGARS